ncbi:hypothetical protein [Hymenobacter rigui]|uniref:Uncharacterized protein n=1 Tax=Hymenobacter rigui TaxID=334424 RepID=A0A428K9P9_9BACT|nr:hypothetical protein [Hymenobacter rigui]RSK43165.1 hypothetical protein EI291_22145 [Hymenobacter rigui]
MTPDPEINPCPGYRPLRFADASSHLVVRAFTDAHARLLLRFPNLSCPTWSDALRELQSDILVNGREVSFDWQALTTLAQQLAASTQHLPYLPGLLGEDIVAAPQSENELPSSLAGPEVSGSIAEAELETATILLADGTPQSLQQLLKHRASRNRTFHAIIKRHPRGNGKFGFTVRELCRSMRIGAETLTKAKKDPGRLSINSLRGLADAMGEPHPDVINDIMLQTMAKKARADARLKRNSNQ